MLKLLIALVLGCILVAAEDVCLLDSEEMKSPLQVAFVIDRTVVSEDRSVWTLFQNETIYHLMPELTKYFRGTEFAVTAFADFPDDPKTYSNAELDECFTTTVKFLLDQSEVMKKVNTIKQLHNQFDGKSTGGGYYGIMSTAAHLDLGWKDDFKIRKVSVLFTNTYPSLYDGNKQQQKPKGDGSDTCRTSLPPEPTNDREFELALIRKDMLVVVVYLRSGDDNYFSYYDEDFDILFLPYIRVLVPSESSVATADILQTYDYKALAKTIADRIYEELQICTYTDPPSYNTFGL